MRRYWNSERVIRSIETFIHETGYFPTKKDFNGLECLPSYSTYQSINIGRNIEQIEQLREQLRAENRTFFPRLNYPRSKMINIVKEYRNRTGTPFFLEMDRFFYIITLHDGLRISFFDTPFVLGHKHRYEELKDEVMFVNPCKVEWVLQNMGFLAECKQKNKKEEDEVSTLISSLLE